MKTIFKSNCNGGGTLLELLISVAIFAIFAASIYTVYLTTQKMLYVSYAQANAVISARKAMETLERAIRGCKSAAIMDGGNRIELVEDMSHDPSDQDNVTKALYFENGDGDDNTTWDNRLVFCPDVSQPGNTAIVTPNVVKLSGNDFFALSSGSVIVNFSVKFEYPIAPAQSADMTTEIDLRN